MVGIIEKFHEEETGEKSQSQDSTLREPPTEKYETEVSEASGEATALDNLEAKYEEAVSHFEGTTEANNEEKEVAGEASGGAPALEEKIKEPISDVKNTTESKNEEREEASGGAKPVDDLEKKNEEAISDVKNPTESKNEEKEEASGGAKPVDDLEKKNEEAISDVKNTTESNNQQKEVGDISGREPFWDNLLDKIEEAISVFKVTSKANSEQKEELGEASGGAASLEHFEKTCEEAGGEIEEKCCIGPNSKYLKLISEEGNALIVEREIALKSPTIGYMLNGPVPFQEDEEVKVPLRIPYRVLHCIIDYMKYQLEYTNSTQAIPYFIIDKEIEVDLLLASIFFKFSEFY